MPRILIAPNSFKECAGSVRLADLFHKALEGTLMERYKRKDFHFIDKPVSDGGDGFLDVCVENFHLKREEITLPAPFEGGEIRASFGYSPENKTVYVESAGVLGMRIIPPEKRHPLELSSKGLGELFLWLKNSKASGRLQFDQLTLGIGGTGTNDFAIGMASALGLRLLDEKGRYVKPLPESFRYVKSVEWEDPGLDFEIEAILDVNTPLLGQRGAARIFAPQKGATPPEVEELEKGLECVVRAIGKSDSSADLLGAGGGLAGGLHYFLGAKYKFARDFLREDLGINSARLKPDLVVTGEGVFDSQSMMQKGVSFILDEFRRLEIPVFVCAGKIKDVPEELAEENVKFIELSKFFTSPGESMRNIEKGVELASEEILKIYFANRG
ncbi:MAG: glycerate kinase [Ignavibacteria bacterium]|jgi:glycerate kinase|nr:glycerate kinase [Ignavibacteria bacterium]MCU7504528.1 glycerate kinase [Ignavibacteria bacterium]MCU7516634.1 glycerate kinase [Ignavibacteria bacterium]